MPRPVRQQLQTGSARVYMNLAAVLPASIPSESVFSQLALTVTDRRGSMLDCRAARRTVSSMRAKTNLNEMLKKPVAQLGKMDKVAILLAEDRFCEESEGILCQSVEFYVRDG